MTFSLPPVRWQIWCIEKEVEKCAGSHPSAAIKCWCIVSKIYVRYVYKSKSAADSLTRMHRLLSYRFVQEIPICRTNSRNRRRWRMHPFFTFCTRVCAHAGTHQWSHVFHVSYPSSLPPFLFSSFPDPTRGHPRRSCFLLLVWASAAHTPTLLYTLPASLCTHIRTASQSGSSAVQTSLPLCCGGQELDVCVCVNVSMYTDRHRVKGLDETP